MTDLEIEKLAKKILSVIRPEKINNIYPYDYEYSLYDEQFILISDKSHNKQYVLKNVFLNKLDMRPKEWFKGKTKNIGNIIYHQFTIPRYFYELSNKLVTHISTLTKNECYDVLVDILQNNTMNYEEMQEYIKQQKLQKRIRNKGY